MYYRMHRPVTISVIPFCQDILGAGIEPALDFKALLQKKSVHYLLELFKCSVIDTSVVDTR